MGISFWCPLRSWNPNLAMVLELRADPAWTSFHPVHAVWKENTCNQPKFPRSRKWLIVLHIWGLFHYPQTPNCPFWIEYILLNRTKLVVFFLTHIISFAYLWHWLVSSKVYNDKRLALNTSQLIKNNLGLLGAFLVIDLLLWRVDHGQCYSSFLPCKSFSY